MSSAMQTTILMFPLSKRIGKIRSTAAKMLAKSTNRHAAFYRDQVTDALRAQLDRVGLSAAERDAELVTFWSSVQAEMIRMTWCDAPAGGMAA